VEHPSFLRTADLGTWTPAEPSRQPGSQHRGDLAGSPRAFQTGFSDLLLDDDECRESLDPKALKKVGSRRRVDCDELELQVVAPVLEDLRNPTINSAALPGRGSCEEDKTR
jgi:hypothetical protein